MVPSALPLVQTGPLESKAGGPELCLGPRCPVWLCLSFPLSVAVSIRGLVQEGHPWGGAAQLLLLRGIIPASELLVLVWKPTEFLLLLLLGWLRPRCGEGDRSGLRTPRGVTQQRRCPSPRAPPRGAACWPRCVFQPLSATRLPAGMIYGARKAR